MAKAGGIKSLFLLMLNTSDFGDNPFSFSIAEGGVMEDISSAKPLIKEIDSSPLWLVTEGYLAPSLSGTSNTTL